MCINDKNTHKIIAYCLDTHEIMMMIKFITSNKYRFSFSPFGWWDGQIVFHSIIGRPKLIDYTYFTNTPALGCLGVFRRN